MDFVLLKRLMCLVMRPQWVVRRGKVPFSPLPPYLVAKSNEPETWGFLGDALDAFRTGIFDGVGFEFGNFPSGTERVSGIDLDHVIREDGTLEPFAAEIVERVNSYTEYSPSGKGLHILCMTTTKDIGRRKEVEGGFGLEMYNHGRYFTVTGKIYGEARDVEERTEEFLEVYERYFGESRESGSDSSLTREVSDLSDRELLLRMFRSKHGTEIEKLYKGDWSKYATASEGDLALVSHLMFWTQRDVERVDRMFRQSGLMRRKWDREDYRERTLDVALKASVASYSPSYYNDKASRTQFIEGVNSLLPLTGTTSQSMGKYLKNGLREDKVKFKEYKSRKTGFENLDRVTKLYPGLYVLGAISSLGKTTFACQLADQLTKSGEHVLFFSLEQSRFELATKGLSRLTAIRNMKTALSAMEIREGKEHLI